MDQFNWFYFPENGPIQFLLFARKGADLFLLFTRKLANSIVVLRM
jgi:hypothetical protein